MTWARLNPDAHPSWWATRLSLVRRFAAYLNANGVDVPVIPSGLLPARKPRAVPFIYSQDDIDALLAACDTEFTDERIAATVRTVIGLLAATGLRISESLNLGARRSGEADQGRGVAACNGHRSRGGRRRARWRAGECLRRLTVGEPPANADVAWAGAVAVLRASQLRIRMRRTSGPTSTTRVPRPSVTVTGTVPGLRRVLVWVSYTETSR